MGNGFCFTKEKSKVVYFITCQLPVERDPARKGG